MKHKTVGLILLASAAAFSQAIVVVSPNGGESYAAGQKVAIQWTADTLIPSTRIALSLNNGASWSTVCDYGAGSGSYFWTVPYLKKGSTQALVRVTANDITNPPWDVSDGVFSIAAAPPDAYEPNDDTAHAYAISLGDSVVMNAVAIGSCIDTTGDSSNSDVDFFRVDLAANKLVSITVFSVRSVDSLGDTISGSGGNPYVELYNASGNRVAGGAYSVTYNVPQAGTYYCRISVSTYYYDVALWCTYGLSVKAVTSLAVQRSTIDSGSLQQINDSTYTTQVTADSTDLTITLTLGSSAVGSIVTATLAGNELLAGPGTSEIIKALSLLADTTLSIRSADIIIHYSEADLNGAPETTLVVMWLNDSTSQWSPVSFTIDTVNNIVTAHTTHFSIFGVFAAPSSNVVTPGRNGTAFDLHVKFLRAKRTFFVSYALPSPAAGAEICLYNARGVCVKRQIASLIKAQNSTVLLDCKNLGSGVYILDFRAGKYHVTRAVSLIK